MTRKHFEALAAVLSSLKPRTNSGISPQGQWVYICLALADWCEAQDPSFNRARFLAAIERA